MKRYFSMAWRKHEFRDELKQCLQIYFPTNILSTKSKELLWKEKCTPRPEWLFKELEEKNYTKRDFRYRGKTKCYSCKGKRLRIEASYVKKNKSKNRL
jgi:excinuclease ABC subunit A